MANPPKVISATITTSEHDPTSIILLVLYYYEGIPILGPPQVTNIMLMPVGSEPTVPIMEPLTSCPVSCTIPNSELSWYWLGYVTLCTGHGDCQGFENSNYGYNLSLMINGIQIDGYSPVVVENA